MELSVTPTIDNTLDNFFAVVRPEEGALVNWKELTIIESKLPKEFNLAVYILAHDGLWHKQHKPHSYDCYTYFCKTIFGYEENRSGWDYQIICVACYTSYEDMPEVLAEFNSTILSTPRIRVTRK